MTDLPPLVERALALELSSSSAARRSPRPVASCSSWRRALDGDWHELMPGEAPFDRLFYDGGGKQHPEVEGDQVLGLVAPGGTVVMDDLTPDRPGPDPVREFWLGHRELAAVELVTTPETAAIVATRV